MLHLAPSRFLQKRQPILDTRTCCAMGGGYKLVNDGVDTRTLAAYLGNRNMANTARYTRMDARRFDGLWRD
jgi:hypothetical protein